MSERQPIMVGIDLRPIPLQMQDDEGTIYHFNPDPDTEFFAAVSRLKESKNKTSDDPDSEDGDEYAFVDDLRATLRTQIVSEEDQKVYDNHHYGLTALDEIADTYAAAVLGRPTQPSN
jgi:hypothetical protein